MSDTPAQSLSHTTDPEQDTSKSRDRIFTGRQGSPEFGALSGVGRLGNDRGSVAVFLSPRHNHPNCLAPGILEARQFYSPLTSLL